MNTTQSRILLIGAVLFVVAGIFVPWDIDHRGVRGQSIREYAGYRLIFSPPKAVGMFSMPPAYEVIWPRVAITLVVIGVATAAAFFAAKKPTP